jgi:hypothetical protein
MIFSFQRKILLACHKSILHNERRSPAKTIKSMKILSSSLAFALVSITSFTSLHAQIVAVQSYSGGFESTSPADSNYGWTFTVGASSLSVSQLGLLDLGSSGFADAHKVGIWDSAGSLVTSVDFAAGETGTLNNGFRYLAVASPVTLQAGQTYSIGNWSSGGSDSYLANTTATYSSDINFVGASIAPGGGFTAPNEVHSGLNYGAYGPNLEYTSITPVPEPQEYATVCGIGLLAFAGWRKVRRASA